MPFAFTVAMNLHVRHKNRDLQFVGNVYFIHKKRKNNKQIAQFKLGDSNLPKVNKT